jgi:homoserine kinase type II
MGFDRAMITRIAAGTATANYLVSEESGGRWFAKVYRDRGGLERERAAVELAEFARAGGVPVPAVRRTCAGELIADDGSLGMSVWEYVADAETAEGGLTGERWRAVGAMLGRLHRRLASHPAAAPARVDASGVRDVERSRDLLDRLISEYGRRRGLSSFESFALDAAREKRSLLDRVAGILRRLPELTQQIVHGDLAGPNLMLRGDEVAGVIDFQPPTARYVSWEIARIGCDPRTIVLGDQWMTGLPELLVAYRGEYPAARPEDLVATVAVGCAYTLASTYPLAEPLHDPDAVDASLEAYGRARHEAALIMLAQLDEVESVLRDRVR